MLRDDPLPTYILLNDRSAILMAQRKQQIEAVVVKADKRLDEFGPDKFTLTIVCDDDPLVMAGDKLILKSVRRQY
jgi:hypothetical protein